MGVWSPHFGQKHVYSIGSWTGIFEGVLIDG